MVKMKSAFILFSLSIHISLLGNLYSQETFELKSYLPLDNDFYWSYLGELDTDEFTTRINLRTEEDAVTLLNNRSTVRITQRVVPSLSESLNEIDSLNKRIYSTTHNGWRIFREESTAGVLDYERSARLLPNRVSIGDYAKYTVRLDEDSGQFGLIRYFTVVDGIEEIEIPNGFFTALKINQEKRTKLASDEDFENVSLQRTEYTSNWFVEGVGLVRQDAIITEITDAGSETINYNIDLFASASLPNYLWPDAQETPEGWKHVDWFGHLTDNYFPWIFHSDHGWLFVDADNAEEIKLWSESLGWWLTSESLYPTFYALDLNEWLSFEEKTALERRFIRSDGTIITANNQGFRFRPSVSRPPATQLEDPLEAVEDSTFFDSDGNRYLGSDAGFQQDQGEPPTITLLSPFEGSQIRERQAFVILVDVNDPDGEVVEVRFFVNGRLVDLVEEEPFNTIYSPPEDIETLNVLAIAKDNLGNTAQSETVVVTVNLADQKPPKVRISSPLNRTIFKNGDRVFVDMVATDADGFVENVVLLVDGVQVGEDMARPPYHISFIPPVNGNYQLTAVATDDDDNETTSSAVNLTVNESGTEEAFEEFPPEVRISAPINRATFELGQPITIVAFANDDDGQIDRVQIFVDGIQVSNDLSFPPYTTVYTPPLAGSYNITAMARDDDRNTTTSNPITITVTE